MKRIIITVLILTALILSGCKDNITGGTIVCNEPYLLVGTDCCLDDNDNSICDKDETETINAEQVEPPKGDIQEIIEEPIIEEVEVAEEPEKTVEEAKEFTVKAGDVITFGKKRIEIRSVGFFQGKLETTLDVDGYEISIYDTKSPELIKGKGLKIQTLKFNQLESSAVIKVEPFELGLNEYLVDTRTTIRGIEILDIFDDGSILFNVKSGGEYYSKKRLKEGETEKIAGMEITNIQGFPRTVSGIKLERYALIKIN